MNTNAVVDFLKDERNWITRATLVQSLVSLGEHSGGVWPRVNADDVDSAIAGLIAQNEIIESPYGLRWKDYLFVDPVEKSPHKVTKKTKQSSDQGMLF